MNRTFQHLSLPQSLRRVLPSAMAALAVAFSMSSHAGGGEALDIELPSMRTPMEAVAPQPLPAVDAPIAAASTATTTAQAPLTRADVRESLKMARLSNTMTPSGEIGDTPAVLQAREDFNALQTEVLQAEYAAATAREQAVAMALRTSTDGQASGVVEQEIVVAPDMTVGELMSFLQDSRAEGTVYVVLPNADETEAD